MEENQIQNESEVTIEQFEEPTIVDNSTNEKLVTTDSTSEQLEQEEGQSFESKIDEKDPAEELILGKFKSIEDLKKAYEELQKHQGQSSEELGFLRKEIAGVNEFKESFNFFNSKKDEYLETILRDKEKYSTPEYFQDPTFKEIYKEALLVYGSNLDTERMIELVEQYVSKRIQLHEKNKLAKSETQKVLDSMGYSKNPQSKFAPPKKSFDEMTPQEVDELLDRLI